MKRVVVIADTGWAVGRIHRDLQTVLASEYTFTFHTSSNFFMEAFLRDFRTADVCLTTLNHYQDMLTLFPKLRDRNKIALVCHGYPELKGGSLSTVFTYGVTSSVLSSRISVPYHVVLTGVNPKEFTYTEPTGRIRTLGWCGCRAIESKRAEWGHALAKQTKLPISYAETLSPEDLKEWYKTIDVLLVTAGPEPWKETGPLPPFEAICSGVLVIGVPVGNFSLLPGPKFHTIEEAVKILTELKADPARVKALAKEQYDCVMAKWTYDTTKESWRSLFEAVLTKTPTLLHQLEIIKTKVPTPLCEIMGSKGSDKGNKDITVSHHNYTTVYHRMFDLRREEPLRIFELGLGTTDPTFNANMGPTGKPGASLRGWTTYFPRASVFGADLDESILFEEERIKTYPCDQTNPERIAAMWETPELHEGFDIIVDDGWHNLEANKCFFENSIHKLNPDGYYVIEDVNNPLMEAQVGKWAAAYPWLSLAFYRVPSTRNAYDNTLVIAHNTRKRPITQTVNAVCYINLEKRTDRRGEIEAELAKAGTPTEKCHRIEAIYNEKGIVGCVESHIKTLEYALEKGWEWTMVLEDDYVMRTPEEFWDTVHRLLQQTNPDVLLLSQGTVHKYISEETIVPHCVQVRQSVTTSGYVIHRSYIPTLIANFKESRELYLKTGNGIYRLDEYWSHLQKEGRWYGREPTIGYQRSGFSDICQMYIARKC